MSGGDDQRYPPYHTSSGMNPPYNYPTYPASASYSAGGYAQDSGRRRNDVGQPSPVPPPFTAAGQYTYTVPPGYVVAHSAGHWAPSDQQAQSHAETQHQSHQHQPAAPHQSPPSQTSQQQQWQQAYNSAYAHPASSQPGGSTASNNATTQTQPLEQRGPYSAPSPGVSSPQITERARPPASSQQQRERPVESPPTTASPGSGTGIDFAKLMDSTRFILESTSAHPGQVQPEQFERMMDSAAFAAQMLDSAATQAPLAAPRPGDDDGGTNSGKKRQKPDAPAQEGQVCLGCQATSTPEWRRGPMGPRTLCNACGLVYAKMIKKRARNAAGNKDRGKSGVAAAGDESEGSGSDDDSHGSPGHRSG